MKKNNIVLVEMLPTVRIGGRLYVREKGSLKPAEGLFLVEKSKKQSEFAKKEGICAKND